MNCVLGQKTASPVWLVRFEELTSFAIRVAYVPSTDRKSAVFMDFFATCMCCGHVWTCRDKRPP